MTFIHPEANKGKKIVIIVGGGFAGLNAAKELSKLDKVHTLLIDEKNYHLFQPLLYQVATAGLGPSDIAVPIRAQFSRDPHVQVHLGQIKKVNLKTKTVVSANSIELAYDYLILACGVRHSYFGKPEWETFAPGLKTIEQATEIRRRILLAFEKAENEPDDLKRQALLTFVIVGAGPTGVEMAGAIAEISQTVISRDFKQINTKQSKIILIEAGNKVLASFADALSKKAKKNLQQMRVEVLTGTRVIDINENGVRISTNQFIPAKTIIWAAGVQAAPMDFDEEIEKDHLGKIVVNKDFSLPLHPEVFAVGDLASFAITNKVTLPGLAPVAKQSGRHAALMIKRSIAGESRYDFKYFDKGQMATIGKRRAIAQLGSIHLSGFVAWLGWLVVHILYLIGFKNKFFVFMQWTWSYLFAKRGSRLITNSEWRFELEKNNKQKNSSANRVYPA